MDRDTRSIRERYEDVLSRLAPDPPGKLPREDALEAEIERVAGDLTPYLDAYRETLHAEALYDVVRRSEIESAVVESELHQLPDRIQEARKRVQELHKEHENEIDRLKFLLRMLHEARGAKGENVTPA